MADLRAVASLPKLDRNHHITAFVNSQRRFGACYARQGQKVSSKLTRGDVSCINTQLSRSQQEAQTPTSLPKGAFSSPVLKPRVTLPKSKGTNRITRIESRNTSDGESEASGSSVEDASRYDRNPLVAEAKSTTNVAHKTRPVTRTKAASSNPRRKKPTESQRHGKRRPEPESNDVEAREYCPLYISIRHLKFKFL